AIMQMDEVTQQNAALVEQASAAAEAMREQAQGLAKIVSVFKLSGQKQQEATPEDAQLDFRQVPATRSAVVPLRQQRVLAGANDDADWKEF
ncbi:MAG: hypothetical protein HOO95_01155, partial [Gallionella sp.]|nr:hypothetical protein [Gallionella sp.]